MPLLARLVLDPAVRLLGACRPSLADALGRRPPLLLLVLLSGCTVLDPDRYPTGAGKIILTFDDGPSAEVSGQLLDVLDRTGTQAVFCYIGENIEAYPHLASRAIAEGHVVAVHTYSHGWKSLLSTSRLREETERYLDLLSSLPAHEAADVVYFRPPLGLKTPAVRRIVDDFGLQYAYVTLFVNDASTEPDAYLDVMQNIKRRIVRNHGGAIVLHEMRFDAPDEKYDVDKSWLPGAVEAFIEWAKANGYEFTVYPDP